MDTKIDTNNSVIDGKVYTFRMAGMITINGDNVDSFDVMLSPEEQDSIREWFSKRNNRWINFVPLEFRDHNPELYDRLYMTLVDIENQADVEEWMYEEGYDPDQVIEHDPTLDPSVIDNPCVCWPKEMYQEFGVVVPNISLWCKEQRMGYPAYISEDYIPMIDDVLNMHLEILHEIDIEAEFFRRQYPDLYSSLKKALKEWVPDIDSDKHHFCLYCMTLTLFSE